MIVAKNIAAYIGKSDQHGDWTAVTAEMLGRRHDMLASEVFIVTFDMITVSQLKSHRGSMTVLGVATEMFPEHPAEEDLERVKWIKGEQNDNQDLDDD